ncbi:MAG: RusA family crossover junction endodeoxyribonuclease [Cyanobacteria bacterium REEB417]|nr:RusA family crossover junction endodeoxyribonuclease [Cyanobacteria bacterium REEB417]
MVDAGGDCNAPAGPQSVTFRVEGMAPAPQGSKRHIGGGRMVESCREVKPWRLLVAQCAVATGVPLLRGPVRLSLVFVFPRPAGHFRKDGSLKPSAPAHHAVKPDGDKLLRSTGDALTGLVIEDDARIVGCTWEKRYAVGGERPGALITVIPLSQ